MIRLALQLHLADRERYLIEFAAKLASEEAKAPPEVAIPRCRIRGQVARDMAGAWDRGVHIGNGAISLQGGGNRS